MRAASTVTITPVGGPSPFGPAHHLEPSAPAVRAILTAARASAARFQRSEASENGSQGRAPSTLQQGHTRVTKAVSGWQARSRQPCSCCWHRLLQLRRQSAKPSGVSDFVQAVA